MSLQNTYLLQKYKVKNPCTSERLVAIYNCKFDRSERRVRCMQCKYYVQRGGAIFKCEMLLFCTMQSGKRAAAECYGSDGHARLSIFFCQAFIRL